MFYRLNKKPQLIAVFVFIWMGVIEHRGVRLIKG